GGPIAGFRGARRQHQDAGVVGAEVELRDRADHAVGGPAVGRAGGDGEITGQHHSGQRHHDEVTHDEVRCTADDVTRLRLADVDLACPDRLLELGELFDL